MGDSSTIEIGGDYDSLEKALGESSSLFDEFGDHVESTAADVESVWAKAGVSITSSLKVISEVWDSLTSEILRGFDDVYANVKNGTQEFIKMQAEVIRLGANLKATGAVAGFTANGLEQMNEQLKNLSVNGSDAIRSAQMVLLEFKNVRGDVFKDAIKSAMDFAAVTGGALSSAVQHYGQLLNDPIKALESLVDEGAQFSQTQIRLIESMERTNDVVGLQRMVLEKLSETYGGAAKNQADSLWGSIQRLNNIFEDVWRSIGSLLVPTLNSKLVPIMEKVGKVVDYLVKQLQSDGDLMGDAFDYALEKAQEWGEVLLDIGLTVFSALHTAITDWSVTWNAVWSGLKLAAAETLIYVLGKIKQLGEFLVEMWDRAKAAMLPLLELAISGMELVKSVALSVADVFVSVWSVILESAKWAWDNIGQVVVDWAFAAIGAGFLAYHFFPALFKTIYEVGAAAFAGLTTAVQISVDTTLSMFSMLWEYQKTVFQGMGLVVAAFVNQALIMLEIFGLHFSGILGLVIDVARLWLESWLSMFTGIDAGAENIFGKIFKYLKELGFVLFDNLMGDVKAAMRPAMDALDKIGDKFGEAKDKAAAAAADMRNKWNAAFGGMAMPGLDQTLADLKRNTAVLGGDFDKAFGAFKDKFADNLGADSKILDDWKKRIKDAMDASEDPDTYLADDPFRFPGDKSRERGEKGGNRSPFEALDQIRRRIEDAAASPEAEATKKQSDLMQKLHDQHMGKLDKVIDAVDPDKRSAKDTKTLLAGRDHGLFRMGNGMGF